jgi:hypothetical protein
MLIILSCDTVPSWCTDRRLTHLVAFIDGLVIVLAPNVDSSHVEDTGHLNVSYPDNHPATQ